MTYQPYKNATDALKEAVIAALRIDEDPAVLSELWRHFLGVQSIMQNNLHTDKDDTITFPSSEDPYDPYGLDPFTTELKDFPVAAGSVHIPGGLGQDVITFN